MEETIANKCSLQHDLLCDLFLGRLPCRQLAWTFQNNSHLRHPVLRWISYGCNLCHSRVFIPSIYFFLAPLSSFQLALIQSNQMSCCLERRSSAYLISMSKLTKMAFFFYFYVMVNVGAGVSFGCLASLATAWVHDELPQKGFFIAYTTWGRQSLLPLGFQQL